MKARPITAEHSEACTQMMINLVVAGYKIFNPDGIDVTEDLATEIRNMMAAAS